MKRLLSYFKRTSKKPYTLEKQRFLDAVTEKDFEKRLWKAVSLCTLAALIVLSLGTSVLGYFVFTHADRTKFILTPPLQGWTEVYPNQASDEYIGGVFEHVASKLSTWNYYNFEDNLEDLHKRLFSPKLVAYQKENVRLQGFLDKIQKNKLLSIFNIDRKYSDYKWCDKLNAACGIVTGEEELYSDGLPYSKNKIAYFLVGDLKSPTKPNSFYAILVTRVIRTSYQAARTLLDAAKKGELPHETFQALD